MNATRERFGAADIVALFADASSVVVAKGKKTLHFDMKSDAPAAGDFAKAVLGPSGNLRAPTVRSGKKWLVGFHEEAYEAQFG